MKYYFIGLFGLLHVLNGLEKINHKGQILICYPKKQSSLICEKSKRKKKPTTIQLLIEMLNFS